MTFDADVIRWRFLVAGFLFLFFVIGGVRYTLKKVQNYTSREPSELRGNYPSASLATQVHDAQKRAKIDDETKP